MHRGVEIQEFLFFRSSFNLIASIIIVKQAKVRFFSDIKPEHKCTLFVRCAVGTIAYATYPLATKYIPIGIFFLILNSSPIMTAILAYFWTSDRLWPLEAVAMTGAFGGIICLGMAKPSEKIDVENFSDFERAHAYQIGVFLAVITCFTLSVVAVASRKLKSLHFAVMQTLQASLSAICFGGVLLCHCTYKGVVPYVYDSWWIYLEMLLAAALNTMAQSLTTYSNQYSNPANVALFAYMSVLYSFLVDITIFGETFTPLQLIGVSITLSFSVAAAIYKFKLENKANLYRKKGKDQSHSSPKTSSEGRS